VAGGRLILYARNERTLGVWEAGIDDRELTLSAR
jgi:hypothetical protein